MKKKLNAELQNNLNDFFKSFELRPPMPDPLMQHFMDEHKKWEAAIREFYPEDGNDRLEHNPYREHELRKGRPSKEFYLKQKLADAWDKWKEARFGKNPFAKYDRAHPKFINKKGTILLKYDQKITATQ